MKPNYCPIVKSSFEYIFLFNHISSYSSSICIRFNYSSFELDLNANQSKFKHNLWSWIKIQINLYNHTFFYSIPLNSLLALASTLVGGSIWLLGVQYLMILANDVWFKLNDLASKFTDLFCSCHENIRLYIYIYII